MKFTLLFTEEGVLTLSMRVQLPTAIKRQTLEVDAGGKGKMILFRCWLIWGNGGLPVSKLISSTKPRQNPAILSKTRTKGSAPSSCSILKYCALEPKALLSGHPGSLVRSRSCPASGSLLEAPCGAGVAMAMRLLGTAKVTWPMEKASQCTIRVQVSSSEQRARETKFLGSPGLILVSGMGQTGAFSE